MPEPTGKSSWNVLAAGSSFEKLAYLLVPVSNSQNWRGTPSARKVSTPLWTSLMQPADNVTGDIEQAGIMELPITASKRYRGEIRHEDDLLHLERAREQRNRILQ